MATSLPHLTDNGNGVSFTVTVEFVTHECIVSRDALAKLSPFGASDQDLIQIFSAFEANINGVARRMVAAGVQGKPLHLSEKNFVTSHAST